LLIISGSNASSEKEPFMTYAYPKTYSNCRKLSYV
jgi:hypothetical protein